MAHIGSERILIITHSYTPFINPRAFRWSAIAEKWVEQGKKVDVITSWLPGLMRCEELNGVEVYRVGGGIIERLRTIFRPNSRSTVAHSHSKKSHKQNKFSLKSIILAPIKFLHDKIWKNLYWPDYACTWIGPASNKALELSSMENYSTVISVSDPFSSHLAARKVKEHHPQMNWLVDIGDPFSFRDDCIVNNQKIYRKFNLKKEAQIFELCDTISVTTDSTRRKYAELFYGKAGKIKVIPPLMSNLEEVNEQTRVLPNNNKVKLVYVGTLYRAIRNPELLLQIFEKMVSLPGFENTELHFFGGYDDCQDIFEKFRHLLNEKVFNHGLVNRKTVLKAMTEADVLVNIGNTNRYQLPSKIVEYAGIAKPIVNLHSIEDDSSKEFLSDYPSVLNLYTKEHFSITETADSLAHFIKTGHRQIDENIKNIWRAKYGVETIADAYSQLIVTEPQQSAVLV